MNMNFCMLTYSFFTGYSCSVSATRVCRSLTFPSRSFCRRASSGGLPGHRGKGREACDACCRSIQSGRICARDRGWTPAHGWNWLFFLAAVTLFATITRREQGFSVNSAHFVERHGTNGPGTPWFRLRRRSARAWRCQDIGTRISP
jgi:hypothetical protein